MELTEKAKCPRRLPRRQMGDKARPVLAAAPPVLAGIRAGGCASPAFPGALLRRAPSGFRGRSGIARLCGVNPTAYRCGGSAGWRGEGFTLLPASRWTAACEPHREHQPF